MIAPAKSSGTFKRPEISEVFDDANRGRIPLRVAADRAGFDRVEIAADRARADGVGSLGQRCSQRFEEALAPLDQIQRGAPCRARAEARQLGEELDQGVEFGHRLAGRHLRPTVWWGVYASRR